MCNFLFITLHASSIVPLTFKCMLVGILYDGKHDTFEYIYAVIRWKIGLIIF